MPETPGAPDSQRYWLEPVIIVDVAVETREEVSIFSRAVVCFVIDEFSIRNPYHDARSGFAGSFTLGSQVAATVAFVRRVSMSTFSSGHIWSEHHTT